MGTKGLGPLDLRARMLILAIQGTTLAVGTLAGHLHIYDAPTLSVIRTYAPAHTQRIGALSWNGHILSSGSRDRMVHHRDVREAAGGRPFRKCAGHRQEVCGLRWSGELGMGFGNPRGTGIGTVTATSGVEGGIGAPSAGGASAQGPGGSGMGSALASGGNDNKVCIWDLRGSRRASSVASSIHSSGSGPGGGIGTSRRPRSNSGGDSDDVPLWKFHEHTAAVKALAWDPHVAGVLATGGGTQDKHIRFWNTFTGTMLNELDTGSQVRRMFHSHVSWLTLWCRSAILSGRIRHMSSSVPTASRARPLRIKYVYGDILRFRKSLR